MDKAITDLLEALEFARSQDADVLHMDLMYGEWTEDNLGSMIDSGVAAFRSDQDWERRMAVMRDQLNESQTPESDMAYPTNEEIKVLVDGKPMSFADFLENHLYIDKDWRRDIEFDLGSYRCHEPHDYQAPWANYSRVELV